MVSILCAAIQIRVDVGLAVFKNVRSSVSNVELARWGILGSEDGFDAFWQCFVSGIQDSSLSSEEGRYITEQYFSPIMFSSILSGVPLVIAELFLFRKYHNNNNKHPIKQNFDEKLSLVM